MVLKLEMYRSGLWTVLVDDAVLLVSCTSEMAQSASTMTQAVNGPVATLLWENVRVVHLPAPRPPI